MSDAGEAAAFTYRRWTDKRAKEEEEEEKEPEPGHGPSENEEEEEEDEEVEEALDLEHGPEELDEPALSPHIIDTSSNPPLRSISLDAKWPSPPASKGETEQLEEEQHDKATKRPEIKAPKRKKRGPKVKQAYSI